jgi:hypothetical protein
MCQEILFMSKSYLCRIYRSPVKQTYNVYFLLNLKKHGFIVINRLDYKMNKHQNDFQNVLQEMEAVG